jgi:hypothetical protein
MKSRSGISPLAPLFKGGVMGILLTGEEEFNNYLGIVCEIMKKYGRSILCMGMERFDGFNSLRLSRGLNRKVGERKAPLHY